MLIALRQDVLHRARGHALMHQAQTDPEDEGDAARTEEDMELSATLKVICASELAELDAALIRLKEGRYGVCAQCAEEIPIQRLKAIPETSLCVDCQNAEEKERRRNGTASTRDWSSSYEPGLPPRSIGERDDD